MDETERKQIEINGIKKCNEELEKTHVPNEEIDSILEQKVIDTLTKMMPKRLIIT